MADIFGRIIFGVEFLVTIICFAGCTEIAERNFLGMQRDAGLILYLSSAEDKSVGISINGRDFEKTSFVEVIPKGSTAVIPDGKNCTPIDDLFLETRTITLNYYSIGKYEVTQELYQAVMGKVPYPDAEHCVSGEKQNLRPVAGISWYDAVVFCNKLSELCGFEKVYIYDEKNIAYANKNKSNEYIKSMTVDWDFSKNGFRLPTEAEWEFASRGAGRTSEAWTSKYSGSNISKQVAWTDKNSSGYSDEDETSRTHEVGLKKPNILGIYDMSGNVSEWCIDWYRSITEDNDFSHGNAVKDSGETTDPCLLKGTYDNHSLRGGGYNQSTGYSSNWQRLGLPANVCYSYDAGSNYMGLRLVRRP